jgi:transcriptional regulator with XRE-family HTH domain
MFDTSRALADMANQIRVCRSADGLTLQQLATRSGVAASTIHKVEARQMVPTVSVLLKIAKGLGCRPEELIRDRLEEESLANPAENGALAATQDHEPAPALAPIRAPQPGAKPDVGIWNIVLSADEIFPSLELDPCQRAIVIVEQGEVDLQAGKQRVQMDAGDCIEIEGGSIRSRMGQSGSASLMLIVSPRGDLHVHLGAPRPSAPTVS